MKAFLCKDVRSLDETKYTAMIVPCSFYSLAVKRTDKQIERGKCPICGADIYIEASGWMGHDW